MQKRQQHYRLTDPFCLFYLHFLEGKETGNPHFWQQNMRAQHVVSWRGIAFENVCFQHIEQIKKALGIAGVVTTASAWSKRADDQRGAQIDLVISRADNVLNMCEIKFYGGPFQVDKDYYLVLLGRQELLQQQISPRLSIRSTLITTYGLTRNAYSGAFTEVVTLEDLFQP